MVARRYGKVGVIVWRCDGDSGSMKKIGVDDGGGGQDVKIRMGICVIRGMMRGRNLEVDDHFTVLRKQ